MKTILIGYADIDGRSKPVIVAGPEMDDAEVNAIMEKAKDRHEFPKDILRVEQIPLVDPVNIAVFIHADVAALVRKTDDARIADIKKQQAENQAARDLKELTGKAFKIFTEATKVRNQAIANVSAAKTSAAMAKPGAAENVAKAEAQAQREADAFAIVLEKWNTIKNPKSTPEEIEAAFVALKLKNPPATK